MPMINLKCSKKIPTELLQKISTAVAETIGKPEQYVMVVAEQAELLMAGTPGDAVCAEVRSIGGLNRTVNHELTIKLCVLLNDHMDIPGERIYVTFQSLERDHWGCNGSTFG
ncbi:phenylpyruvate tautomerase MIF-related protein [Pontiella sp.]|uniref:phenylpyruvate tautomerase MIF-related protein n=1 Tax=Pontiella sp. TaxID=2837462 RepID=UPI0035672B5C